MFLFSPKRVFESYLQRIIAKSCNESSVVRQSLGQRPGRHMRQERQRAGRRGHKVGLRWRHRLHLHRQLALGRQRHFGVRLRGHGH
jgi:hypothetical protein